MSVILKQTHQNIRLHDGSGNAISSTAGKLDCELSTSGLAQESTLSTMSDKFPDLSSSLGVQPQSASLSVVQSTDQWNVRNTETESRLDTINATLGSTLTVDGSASTQPISASSLPLPTGASSESTLSAMSAKLPASLGQKDGSASLSVVLAGTEALPEPANGSDLVWDAVSTTVNGKSSSHNLVGSNVSIFGSTSASNTFSIEVSDDDSTWFSTSREIVCTGSTDFEYSCNLGGVRYIRLSSSAVATVSAYITCRA